MFIVFLHCPKNKLHGADATVYAWPMLYMAILYRNHKYRTPLHYYTMILQQKTMFTLCVQQCANCCRLTCCRLTCWPAASWDLRPAGLLLVDLLRVVLMTSWRLTCWPAACWDLRPVDLRPVDLLQVVLLACCRLTFVTCAGWPGDKGGDSN